MQVLTQEHYEAEAFFSYVRSFLKHSYPIGHRICIDGANQLSKGKTCQFSSCGELKRTFKCEFVRAASCVCEQLVILQPFLVGSVTLFLLPLAIPSIQSSITAGGTTTAAKKIWLNEKIRMIQYCRKTSSWTSLFLHRNADVYRNAQQIEQVSFFQITFYCFAPKFCQPLWVGTAPRHGGWVLSLCYPKQK